MADCGCGQVAAYLAGGMTGDREIDLVALFEAMNLLTLLCVGLVLFGVGIFAWMIIRHWRTLSFGRALRRPRATYEDRPGDEPYDDQIPY